MDFVDQIIENVANSTELSPDTRTTVTDFLQTNRDLLERVGPDAVAAFFQTLSARGGLAAFEALVGDLQEPDLLTLLTQLGPQMETAIGQRAQSIADFKALAQSVGTAAMEVLTKLVLAAI